MLVVVVRVRKQRMYKWLAQPYLVVSQCDTNNFNQLNGKNSDNKQGKKLLKIQISLLIYP